MENDGVATNPEGEEKAPEPYLPRPWSESQAEPEKKEWVGPEPFHPQTSSESEPKPLRVDQGQATSTTRAGRDRRWPIGLLAIALLIGSIIGGLVGGRLVELTQHATSAVIPGTSTESTPAPSSSGGTVAAPAGSTINANAIYKQAS